MDVYVGLIYVVLSQSIYYKIYVAQNMSLTLLPLLDVYVGLIYVVLSQSIYYKIYVAQNMSLTLLPLWHVGLLS